MRIVESAIITAVFLAGVIVVSHIGVFGSGCHVPSGVFHQWQLED